MVTDRRYGFGERGAYAAFSTSHLPCDSPTYQKPIESAMPVAQKRIIANLGVDLLLPQVQIEWPQSDQVEKVQTAGLITLVHVGRLNVQFTTL
jgi:hypothetical protein